MYKLNYVFITFTPTSLSSEKKIKTYIKVEFELEI